MYFLQIPQPRPSLRMRTTIRIRDRGRTYVLCLCASVSLISEETYWKTWKGERSSSVDDNQRKAETLYKRHYPADRGVTVQVKVNPSERSIGNCHLVVKGQGSSLLGRDWLHKFKMIWQQIFSESAIWR